MLSLRLGAFGACVVTLAVYIVFNAGLPKIPPDAWSYYELSKTLFEDFYRISTIRQFAVVSDFGVSFPPLYPLLLWSVNQLSELGIMAGTVVNILTSLCVGLLLWNLGARLFGEPLYGLLIFALLLASPTYMAESVYPLTGNLALFFLLCGIWVATTSNELSLTHFSILGVICGLATLLRFDSLLPGIAFGAISSIRYRSGYVCGLLVFAVAYLITMSPWVVYSLTHFSRLFVSDNTLTVVAVMAHHPTHFYSASDVLPTIFNSPWSWLQQLLHHMGSTFLGFLRSLIEFNVLLPVALAMTGWFLARRTDNITLRPMVARLASDLGPAIAMVLVLFATVALTGYDHVRYFLRLDIVLVIFIVGIAAACLDRQKTFEIRWITRGLFVLIFGSQVMVWSYFLVFKKPATSALSIAKIDYSYQPFVKAMREEQDVPVVLIQNDFIDPYRFGAVTGIRTIIEPRNLNPCNLRQIIATYRVNHLMTANEAWVEAIEGRATRKAGWPEGLWRLEDTPPAPAIVCSRLGQKL